jgi:alkylation response protein AidB-like acyl-CoA dehydrogenase
MVPRLSTALFHDILSTDETVAVRGKARQFAEQHVSPAAAVLNGATESPDVFPRDLFRRMGSEGLFAIPFGKEVGGSRLEYPAMAACSAVEELAYYSNSVAAIFDVHCILAGQSLAGASDELRSRYLPPLISGEAVASFATSEPGASSDLSPNGLQTRIRGVAGELLIRGRKRWITNAPVADFLIVLCGVLWHLTRCRRDE